MQLENFDIYFHPATFFSVLRTELNNVVTDIYNAHIHLHMLNLPRKTDAKT